MIFLDMRDRQGIVQVVFDPDTGEHFQRADRVRSEYVLRITGRVRARSAATVNPAMATGTIEVLGKQLEILNQAATPPFQLDEYTAVGEEVRLQYRYMDLRRQRNAAAPDPALQNHLARCAISSMARASWTSKPRSSPGRPRKARGITWCQAAPIRASFLRCPSRPSCSSSC